MGVCQKLLFGLEVRMNQSEICRYLVLSHHVRIYEFLKHNTFTDGQISMTFT